MIKITLPDGSIREYSAPVTALKIAEDIGPKLAEEAICAEVNNKMVDINYPIDTDATVVIHTFHTEKGKEVYWHSTAHLMAQAVKQLFPEVKIAIGPAIEQGFYYDFDRDESFTEEDLQKIEAKMQELSAQALPYDRTE